ncbi:TonB-dependent receptor [Lewinella cohaerens]|uniref:TonB-dependent receptor n=1 Tax=Lewinella cohaerens TaxID=70995 RepID=UPI00036EA689|nr:carboxypeptidase regulatory-like domain-containing protein [Lewinella cohaerens]
MKRSLLFFTLLLFSVSFLAAQSASLSGKVVDRGNKEPILFGTVSLYQNGVLKSGTETDFDGNYNFANLDPGTYEVRFGYLGYQTATVTGVQVFAGKAIKLDGEIAEEGVLLDIGATVTAYRVPLVEQDNTTQGGTLTSDQIRSLPTRNINALAATTAGLSTADEGDAVNVRGSRNDATNYYVDGIRVQGNLIPESEIDQLQVITGGVEARYGDVTGGIISITTKGPSDKFSGGIEAETSQYLDPYDNSLLGINLSGPILRNKKGVSVLGFRVAGRYTYRLDDDPSAVPVYRVKDDVLAELEANPVIIKGGTPFVAADFLTNDDVDGLDVRPFEEQTLANFNAKLDARFSDAIDVTLSGTYFNGEDMQTPNENSSTGASWRTLNSHNNPTRVDTDYRVNFRFRHRLGGAVSGEGDDRKVSTVQNAMYTLQGSYENETFEIKDPRHGDDYFAYGHVGTFDVDYIPVFEQDFDTLGNRFLNHVDYREVLRNYDTGNSSNPVLANYNNPLGLAIGEGLNAEQPGYVVQGILGENNNVNIDNLYAINGRVNDIFNNSWGFHSNVGSIYNRALQQDNDVTIFNASASFDLVPGGSEKGRHNIQLGIVYEGRVNRSYDVRDPRRLWTAARQNANAHIQGIDRENADTLGLYSQLYDAEGLPDPFFDANILSLTLQNPEDARFYRAIRESLGVGLDEYVNIDGLTPDQLSLSMFSAKELNDQFILDYYGYDYLGNEFDGTFEDFFTTVDAEGIRTFPVAAARPLYTSAYIQDKFTFRDIIFRLGVRIDRYDANTKVLQDPYSLYSIQGAEDFHNNFGGSAPGNIGSDFRVYTENDNGETVQAYRDGDNWYKADGTPVNGANEIEGIRTGLVFPKYQDPNAHESNYIKSEEFNPESSFKDYEVQFNVMPRLAFSFPISDKANFFAHYDVLVQRPNSSTIATALDYFYFVERTGSQTFSNASLRPERTVDYEVGFQQALTQSSAIKISAYYKEMRDMIQLRTFFPVPIVGQYTTFDNQDFGTVKGFSFGYDLRRTRNLTLNANYTLQFADGTGSDTESQRGLTNRGNLRTLFPLNFDERHRFNLVADYRFPQESGPRVAGAYILANAGINFQAVAVSGRPYTAKQVAQELGGVGTIGAINGSRKPWNTTINLRIDKNFDIGDKLGLNVYLRISNVLDTRNIINVYSVTGDPEDDGFLRSSFGQDQIESISGSQREIEAYLASYQWRLLNSDFYSLPRRLFIGAIMDF